MSVEISPNNPDTEWKMPTDDELKKQKLDETEKMPSHKVIGADKETQSEIDNINALFELKIFPKEDADTHQKLKYLYFDKVMNHEKKLPDLSKTQESINKNINKYLSCLSEFKLIQNYQKEMPDFKVAEMPYTNIKELFDDFRKYENSNTSDDDKKLIEDKFKHLKNTEEIFKIAEETRKSNKKMMENLEVQEDLKKAA